MKYTVGDVYRIQSYKDYFSKTSLLPSIECIMIAKSTFPIEAKIAALSERYEAYSDAEFEVGDYHFMFDNGRDFKRRLGLYIDCLKEKIGLIHKHVPGVHYEVDLYNDYGDIDETRFPSFYKALQYAKEKYWEDYFKIVRYNDNDEFDTVIYEITYDFQVYDFSCLDMWQFDISDASCKLPSPLPKASGFESTEVYMKKFDTVEKWIAHLHGKYREILYFDDYDALDEFFDKMEKRYGRGFRHYSEIPAKVIQVSVNVCIADNDFSELLKNNAPEEINAFNNAILNCFEEAADNVRANLVCKGFICHHEKKKEYKPGMDILKYEDYCVKDQTSSDNLRIEYTLHVSYKKEDFQKVAQGDSLKLRLPILYDVHVNDIAFDELMLSVDYILDIADIFQKEHGGDKQ